MSFYAESRHKSRSTKQCVGCWFETETNPIRPGQFYWATRGKSDGEFWCCNLCELCHLTLEIVQDGPYAIEWVEWGAGDLWQHRQECADWNVCEVKR